MKGISILPNSPVSNKHARKDFLRKSLLWTYKTEKFQGECVSLLCVPGLGYSETWKKKPQNLEQSTWNLKKKICSKFRGSCKRRMVFVWTDSISPASKRTDSSQKADTNYKTSCAFLNLHAWEMKTLYFIEYCEGLGWRPLMQKWFEFFLDVWQD